jgi:hypothetical protein
MHDLDAQVSGPAGQSSPVDAEVLAAALKRALDAAEYHLCGPRYVGCRVDPVPDVQMAGLMVAVAQQLHRLPPATGTTRPRAAWRRQVARLNDLASQLCVIPTPAQASVIEHFVAVYLADAARELRARRFLDLGDGAAEGPSTTRLTDAASPPTFTLSK